MTIISFIHSAWRVKTEAYWMGNICLKFFQLPKDIPTENQDLTEIPHSTEKFKKKKPKHV